MIDGIIRINATTTRLGGLIDLDGSASWAPTVVGDQQPISCYLIDKGDRTILIDTGIASHRGQVQVQLAPLVPEANHFIVCLTRAELDCSGNISAIHKTRRIDELVRGSISPFDDFERGAADVSKLTAFPVGTSLAAPIGEPPFLTAITPRIKMLTTFWFYDPDSKTLFSSDFFGHTSLRPGQSVLLRLPEDDESNFETVRDHILAKYWWLPRARTRSIRQWLVDLFETYNIETIAPTHGRVLQGGATVKRHLNLVLRVLTEESTDK